MNSRVLLAVLLFVIVIGGCGQKGELYLPDGPRDQQEGSR